MAIPTPQTSGSGRSSVLKKVVALLALAAILAGTIALFPTAQNHLMALLERYGWGFLLQPQFLFMLAGFLFELFVAFALLWGGLLAQAEPTAGEIDLANVWIFILLTVSAIISEIVIALTFAPGGPPGWVIALLVILASLLLIYGTFIWLWTTWWILARRRICYVFVPWFRTKVLELWLTSLTCLQWAAHTYSVCAQWGIHTLEVCGNWVSTTTRTCISWSTTTSSRCKSWLPGFLGWICVLAEIVVDAVCVLFAVVVVVACVLWFIVVELVCLLWLLVTVLVCLAWMLIVTVILIVVLIFLGLLIIFFLCW